MIADKDIQVEEGYDIKINCSARGNPKPAVKWMKRVGALPPNTGYEDDQRTLVIRSATMNNSGQYLCIVGNRIGNSSDQATVVVNKRLSFFLTSPSSIKSSLHNNVTLTCIYEHGVKPVVVEWFKSDKRLTGNRYIATRKNQVLTITNLTATDFGSYKCIVKSKFTTIQSVTKIIGLPKTCKDIRAKGSQQSGTYQVYPVSSQSVNVYCDMASKNGVGVTVISHDSEARTWVIGKEAPFSARRVISYEISNTSIKGIVESSSKCEQYIKYECKGSMLAQDRYAWWLSVGGQRMLNWGGVDHTRTGCACSLTNSCAKGVCNCDKNDNVWREDSGFLDEKQFLPISEVGFGDTGHPGEEGYYTVGKLKCY